MSNPRELALDLWLGRYLDQGFEVLPCQGVTVNDLGEVKCTCVKGQRHIAG